jgi:hypothetical protein
LQTAIRFAGGGEVIVDLWPDEVRDLVQRALTNNVLLEVKDPDGSSVIINVHTITTIVAGPKPRKSR